MISFTGTPVGYFEPVIDNIGVFVDGFLRTLQIVLYAAAGSLLLGSVIAAFRVSPSLRSAGRNELGDGVPPAHRAA